MNKDIKISVVVPTHNEPANSVLYKAVESYPKSSEIEYIIVDNSTKGTLITLFKDKGCKVFTLPNSNRSEKLQFGLQKASGSILLFHHPRSILDLEAFDQLKNLPSSILWGGFTHCFDKKHLGLDFTSWYSNTIRPKASKIVYLDHCIFFRKPLLDLPIPPLDIFEDTEISKILRKHCSPCILSSLSTTSAIRFSKNGFIKQALKNQYLKLLYNLNFSHKNINSFYEKNLDLNKSKD